MTAGDVLEGRYELRAETGATPFARVFRGWDRDLAKLVTLKVLSLPAKHDGWLEPLKSAVRDAQRLYHPASLRVFDLRITETSVYLVTEAEEGESLREYLQRRKRMRGRNFLSVAEQLVAVLAAAHADGILHGNLRPECIYIQSDGSLRVADFGMGTIWRLWRGSSMIPPYVAPEVVRRGQFSARSDIYAAGCLFYEMLGGNPRDLMSGHRRPIANVPRHVNQLWQECTQQSVRARPRSADALRAGLTNDGLPRRARGRAGRLLLVLIGAILVFAGILSVAVLDSRPPRAPGGTDRNGSPGAPGEHGVETTPTPEG